MALCYPAQSRGETGRPDAPAATAYGDIVLSTARPPSWGAIAVYGGMWAESRLPTFPYNLVTGKVSYHKAYMAGAIGSVRIVDFGFGLFGSRYRFEGFSLEAEAQIFKHFGLQSHVETVAALVLRSGEFVLGRNWSMNVAWGNGISYAWSDPKWEMGSTGIRGVGSRRTQYHMFFETAFTPRSAPQLAVFLRLHHRSGMYGVISPQRTGSNYVGAGFRYSFPAR